MEDNGITVNQELRVHPAEHQIFLNFGDDLSAEMFYDWLYERGFDDFKVWSKENEGKY